MRRLVWQTALFLFLTILTEIGGLVYLAASMLARIGGRRPQYAKLLIFIPLYAGATLATRHVAPLLNRVPLSCLSDSNTVISVSSPFFCILNRNYVTPQLRDAADALATQMATVFPGTATLALDANFPYFDGFPLLPHLSHDDGRKLDIAFYYRKSGSYQLGLTRSPVGYFAFEQPRTGDVLPCADRNDWLTLRWDLPFLQAVFPSYELDDDRMREALRWLANEGKTFGVEKVFIEPHLVSRLGVEHDNVRFQGCRAARHDDHIHFQVR